MTAHALSLHTFDPAFDADQRILHRINVNQSASPQFNDPDGKWAKMSSQERVDAIVRMDATGMTKREIGDDLDTTRNAIAGFAFHHHIRLLTRDRIRPVAPPTEPAEPISPAAWAVLPGTTPKRMADTGPQDCMWPVGDGPVQMFCCALRIKGSYCDHHARRNRRGRVADLDVSATIAIEARVNDAPPVLPEDVARELGVVEKAEVE